MAPEMVWGEITPRTLNNTHHRRLEGGGEHGNVPPPKKKSEKWLEKSGVIFQGYIFSNNFSRNNRKIIFSIDFQNFQNFLKFSQPFVFFVQTRENWTHGF